MNGLCREEEEEGMVGRNYWLGGWDGVGWVGGYRPVVVSAAMTTGRWGHCFTWIHTHREKHMFVGAHFCLSSDVIRVRVISSASLLIVQTKMSKTNGSYLIIWVKDGQQWVIIDGHSVTIFLCLVSPFFIKCNKHRSHVQTLLECLYRH